MMPPARPARPAGWAVTPYKGAEEDLLRSYRRAEKPKSELNLNSTWIPETCDPSLSDTMDFKEFGEESCEGRAEDLDSVKALAEKLKLQTRRPSYVEWQERVESKPWKEGFPADTDPGSPDSAGGQTASVPVLLRNENSELVVRNICGFETIDDALEFLRKELVSDHGTGWFYFSLLLSSNCLTPKNHKDIFPISVK